MNVENNRVRVIDVAHIRQLSQSQTQITQENTPNPNTANPLTMLAALQQALESDLNPNGINRNRSARSDSFTRFTGSTRTEQT